ncbi:glycoside hydrolase family 3 N-terminal domain-containing protein [Actinomyces sp. oral taxon 448]|uniref:glycoside hydrolase family 3 N-terminal domain-containing protein n=1 Tax=Actinomyces sp. oral taxon 448 TaxID=712124 RepID=UPI0002189066|nr:glycoside hydrolase family 3 N-terminal domain-containing protein [Actinomyces sp. oral taxon 448]EGQ74911.1 beta-N-acetylhexosaminidase [Actinomyces sp. oral taxon 448 str. F0400]
MDDLSSPDAPSLAPRRGTGRRPVVLAGLLAATALTRCARGESGPATEQATADRTRTDPDDVSASAAASTAPADTDPLEGWSPEERAGQLIMVGVETAGPRLASIDAVSTHHVGNVFIAGQTHAGAEAIRGVVDAMTALVGPDTTHGTPLLVATDQEGGQVQVLQGSGLSTIPSALEQAAMPAQDLRARALTWGQELADVGVTMNLAPVADLVDVPDPSANAPIGAWEREYGNDPATVLDHATAFAQGMEEAGVIAVYKHFPGLGRVGANTDTASDVTDGTTAPSGDAAVSVFADAIGGGARVVMVSSAVYPLIDDSSPAVFSPAVVTDMLRGDLGFTGVVITDDVSAAAQVQEWDPGQRAVQAVRAGCDIVLASGDPSTAIDMVRALVDQARDDPAFADRIDQSAARVLDLKTASR